MGAIFFATYVLCVLMFIYVLGYILDIFQKKETKVDITIYQLEKESGKYKRVK